MVENVIRTREVGELITSVEFAKLVQLDNFDRDSEKSHLSLGSLDSDSWTNSVISTKSQNLKVKLSRMKLPRRRARLI